MATKVPENSSSGSQSLCFDIRLSCVVLCSPDQQEPATQQAPASRKRQLKKKQVVSSEGSEFDGGSSSWLGLHVPDYQK